MIMTILNNKKLRTYDRKNIIKVNKESSFHYIKRKIKLRHLSKRTKIYKEDYYQKN